MNIRLRSWLQDLGVYAALLFAAWLLTRALYNDFHVPPGSVEVDTRIAATIAATVLAVAFSFVLHDQDFVQSAFIAIGAETVAIAIDFLPLGSPPEQQVVIGLAGVAVSFPVFLWRMSELRIGGG